MLGSGLALAAELLRLAAVRHIGPASRTRGPEVGALASGGPYRFSRNPLYVANLGLWTAVALGGMHWLGAALILLLVLHYALVVRWEESRLQQTHPDAYLRYLQQVPRWLGTGAGQPRLAARVSWRVALRSERSSLAVLVLLFGCLAFKYALADQLPPWTTWP